jgi:hypothetical protein
VIVRAPAAPVAGARAHLEATVAIPLLAPPERHWECPNCDHTDVTREAGPHTRFHYCPKLGLSAPMVPSGTACKVEAVEREDYIGGDDVQRNADGRPVMSVITTRDDGNDVAVYAPTAHLNLRG